MGGFCSEVPVAKEMKNASAVRVRGGFELLPAGEMGIPLTPARKMAMAKKVEAESSYQKIKKSRSKKSGFMKRNVLQILFIPLASPP
jgi:hypothetical protein